MAIVTFNNISREYAGTQVLDNISFELNAGVKVGLIGANGSGKTTILRILCGLEEPNQGSVNIAPNVRIGYVPQHVQFQSDQTVIDYLLRQHRKLKADLHQKEHAVAGHTSENMDRLLAEYQQVRDAYDHCGGDHFEQQTYAMLDALGLTERKDHLVSQLSGGEKNVLALTSALLEQPNLLLLDEPGNHLDYMGLAWLDEFMRKFRGAVLIVSHNRYLLDRVAGGILELENGKIISYPGNYSAYRKIRQERLHAQQNQYNAYQQRLAHLEKLVRKFADIAQGHASDNTWGKRLRARRSQLQREKDRAVEKPIMENSKISPAFQANPTRGDIALQLRSYSKAYDSMQLFDNIDWNIEGGQRWGLVGDNGCGKTTMLRDIIQQAHWEHPTIRLGPSLTIGYCAQEQEVLNGENTVFDELMSIKGTVKEQVLTILARFLFHDQEVYKKVSDLSGGERNRLQLARLMLLKPNFLILDEPTNHLDIPTREAVEEALADFAGTILVVSHDRYFLDKVVDHIAEVHDKKLRHYEGNFTNFWKWRQESADQISGRVTRRGKGRRQSDKEKTKAGGQQWQERKAQAAVERKAKKIVSDLEHKIAEVELEKQKLEQQTAQAFTDGDHQKGHQLSVKLNGLAEEIETLYKNWTLAEEKLSGMES